MAHFAMVDENNCVTQVVVINNEVIQDENGIEQESLGAAFCAELFGGTWIQTSYNGNFRGIFAGYGRAYDPVADKFYIPISTTDTVNE
jgi:hypothetical protein